MKLEKKHYIGIGLTIVILLLIIFFWGTIANALGISKSKKEGDICKTSDGKDGKIDVNGNCVPNKTRRIELKDANGNGTGQYVTRDASDRSISCCAVGSFFIGNCNFPIKKTDHISPCNNL